MKDKKQESEIKSDIEITKNNYPVSIAIAAYKDWIPLVKKSGFKIWMDHHDRLMYDSHIADYLYNEAIKILEPEANKFKNIDQKELYEILTDIQSNNTDASGLYLSAILNATELQEVDGTFNHGILGYRLALGKRLIVRKGSVIPILGDFCRGDIINFGSAYDSMATEGGIQINFGKVFILSNKEGIQINFGERNYMFSGLGILIDFEDIFYMETHINGRLYRRDDFENRNPFLRNLESKLHEIEYLKNLKDHPDKAIREIKAYDWQRFKKEVLALGREIENV